MSEWINKKNRCPKPEDGNKVLGHNGVYAFECEYDDGFWCNIGGETMTHWMPLPAPPTSSNSESEPVIVESNEPCDYCTGALNRKQCESCDKLSMDCFVGRRLRAGDLELCLQSQKGGMK